KAVQRPVILASSLLGALSVAATPRRRLGLARRDPDVDHLEVRRGPAVHALELSRDRKDTLVPGLPAALASEAETLLEGEAIGLCRGAHGTSKVTSTLPDLSKL